MGKHGYWVEDVCANEPHAMHGIVFGSHGTESAPNTQEQPVQVVHASQKLILEKPSTLPPCHEGGCVA